MQAHVVGITLNLLALLAAGVYVLKHLGVRNTSPVDHRLAALLGVLATLVGVRAARWWFEVEAVRRVEEMLAALMPLLALFLAEGLLRRHAPGWLKLVICLGALLFAIAAMARPVSFALPFAYALGGFVALSLLSLAGLLALRDRTTLSHAENHAIGALFIGLILALPLAVTDFLAAGGVSPIRAGGLGMLFFLLAVTRGTAVGGGGLGVLGDALWSAAAAALGFAAFAFVFGQPAPLAALHVAALILALVLTFRIIQHQIDTTRALARKSLWDALASAPTDNLDAFLGGLLAAPELSGAHLVDGEALKGYDQAGLAAAFASGAVLPLEAARKHEQLSVLFDENEATHAVLVARAPAQLLFVNMPTLGAGAEIELQLNLLAKLAQGAAHA